jgi:hypothetical protein
MREYLTFKKLITPALVQVLFWVAIIGNTIEALFYSDGFWNGLALFILGPILIRIFCEGLIVVFEINNTLTEIRDSQNRPLAPPPVAPAPAPVPPVATL